MILTREDLHRRVWARPMPKVAHDLGVAAAELQRLCKSLDVPFPYSGFWRKDAPLDGHARPLPRARPGRPDAVELDLPDPAPSRPPPDPRPDTPTDAATSRDAPSPAPSRDAEARAEPADDRPEDPLDRRWSLIHHRLAEALARSGHTLQADNGRRGFDLKGQLLSYWLREGYTRTKRPLTPKEARDPWKSAGGRDHVYEERMTGRLILAVQTKAYGRKAEWRDHPRRGRLEDRIDEIVAGFEALADDTTRLDAERLAAEARWREAEARRQAAERRACPDWRPSTRTPAASRPSSSGCAPRPDPPWAATPSFARGSHGRRTRSTPTTPRPGTWPRSCARSISRRERGPSLRRTTSTTTTRDRRPHASNHMAESNRFEPQTHLVGVPVAS